MHSLDNKSQELYLTTKDVPQDFKNHNKKALSVVWSRFLKKKKSGGKKNITVFFFFFHLHQVMASMRKDGHPGRENEGENRNSNTVSLHRLLSLSTYPRVGGPVYAMKPEHVPAGAWSGVWDRER